LETQTVQPEDCKQTCHLSLQ